MDRRDSYQAAMDALRRPLGRLQQAAHTAKASGDAQRQALATAIEEDRRDLEQAIAQADQVLQSAVDRIDERDSQRSTAFWDRIDAHLQEWTGTLDRMNQQATAAVAGSPPVQGAQRVHSATQRKAAGLKARAEAEVREAAADLDHDLGELEAALDEADRALEAAYTRIDERYRRRAAERYPDKS